ncbi:hypothetical protein HAX54_000250 [Datura stramonium]|uniref:At1g61320/AtMIF1 LRR domain-containing protein n=1 Tax=Datura stramonium TaxID=4076 RepID=A0ABS8T1N0_DATST|nr:hypothetical protein [Datura stramonium]
MPQEVIFCPQNGDIFGLCTQIWCCKKVAARSCSVFSEIVDKILLQHIGDIVKFVLDVSGVLQLSPRPDIDRWILYATRNGVKKLKLNMTNNTTYKVPSYIYNCPTLTKLKLLNCVFNPPKSFLGFQNLTTLRVEKVTFESAICVINAPFLVNLTLMHCNGTQYLNVVVAGLKTLYVCESHCNLDLSCFMNCKKLTYLYLEVDNNSKHAEGLTLEKLLLSLTTLKVLTLCSPELELLELGVDFTQIGQTYYALELIKSSPKLRKLEIWVRNGFKNRTVFHKAIARSYSIFGKDEYPFGCWLFGKVEYGMRYPRASPKAELFYLTNAD